MRSLYKVIVDELLENPRTRTVAVVSDSTVGPLHGDAFAAGIGAGGHRIVRVAFDAGEKSKNLATFAEIVRQFAALGLTRQDVVVALGGGVTGDLAGFAAATYMRGIDLIQVPTTLLAMVDSSIGGKTGVNLPEGKNLVGAFHKPRLTLRDTRFLDTLPPREMMNGYAEMIKTAVLFDPVLFAEMRVLGKGGLHGRLPALIERCVALKESVVADDFRETGRRKLLNLGHTFGHAIEKVSGYSVSHGEAVAMGLRIVGRNVPEIGEILDAFGFPTPANLDWPEVVRAIAADKKRSGDAVTLVVPAGIGDCRLVDVPFAELDAWRR